jgi:hypothetical protein
MSGLHGSEAAQAGAAGAVVSFGKSFAPPAIASSNNAAAITVAMMLPPRSVSLFIRRS